MRDPQDRQRFTEIMMALSENFGAQISDAALNMRFLTLIEFPVHDIARAAVHLLKYREAKYPPMPTVSEVITAIETVKGIGGYASPRDLAEIEATRVLGVISSKGRDHKPVWSHPITEYLMKARWRYFDLATTLTKDKEQWWRKEFVEAFVSHSNIQKNAPSLLPELPQGDIGKLIMKIAQKKEIAHVGN